MSGRSRRPPVVALNGRAARRRNDEQAPASRAGRGSAPARGNGRHGRGGGRGPSHCHRDESIDTRRYNLDPNLAGQSTSEVLAARADNSSNLQQFDVKHQMYTLLNTNRSASNPNSLTAEEIKSLYKNLFASRVAIIDTVASEANKAALRREMEAPLNANPRSKPGKYEYVIKLVNIWMVMKDMLDDGIDSFLNQRRSRTNSTAVHLGVYVEKMETFEGIAAESVETNRQRAMSMKSERMPPGELERKYLDPGVRLDSVQYPCCPNPNCTHELIDGPPSNNDADRLNEEDVVAHVALCREVSAWMAGNGPQPTDPETGELLTKHPKTPTQRDKFIRCHCHQKKANIRTGDQCPVSCKYKGVNYPVGSCPICKCNCKLFIKMKDYLPMVIANSQPPPKSSRDTQRDATVYLNNSLSVNRIQQEASAQFYNQQIAAGQLAADSNIASHVRNQGHLAGALHMVANRPNQDVLQLLRKQVEATQHPSGPTFTNVGDMRTYGRRSSADDRVRNNGLEVNGLFEGMDEEEQVEIAMVRSTTTATQENATRETEDEQLKRAIEESKKTGGTKVSLHSIVIHVVLAKHSFSLSRKTSGMSEDELLEAEMTDEERLQTALALSASILQRSASAPPPSMLIGSVPEVGRSLTPPPPTTTPELVSRTRSAAFKRRQQTDKSNKKLRKSLTKVAKALSNPKDEAVVNALNAVADEPTPARLDECLDFMEELED